MNERINERKDPARASHIHFSNLLIVVTKTNKDYPVDTIEILLV